MNRLNILSAEDNYGDQKLLELAFEALDLAPKLQIVGNGEDAIHYLWKKGKYASAPRPDLILLDLNLPKVSGREVMAKVRREPSLKNIPVVIFTGAKASPQMAEICELNPSFYVVKPDGIDAFFAIIRAIAEYAYSMANLPKKEGEHARKLRRIGGDSTYGRMLGTVA